MSGLLLSLLRLYGGNLVREQGIGQRTVVSLMTGKALDLGMVLEIIRVNTRSHVNHVARGLLFFLVVRIEMTLNVAEFAVLVESPGNIVHPVDELRHR